MIPILMLLIQPFVFFHDFAMANFEIDQKDDVLILQVKIDKENLENLYHKKDGETADLNKVGEFVQKYLKEHFYLVVDQQKIDFNLQDMSTDKYFYNIALSSQNKVTQSIRYIQLKNTCLIDEIDNHSNVVNFKLNEKYRTFRLHEGRIRIEVKY